MEIDELTELLLAVDRIGLKSVQTEMFKEISETIKGLPGGPWDEYRKLVLKIYSELQSASLHTEPVFQNAINAYFSRETADFKSFKDWLDYTEKQGKGLPSLNLSRYENCNNNRLEALIRNCPDLSILAIKSAAITDSGLGCLKSLRNLASLNLSQCCQLTTQAFIHLKDLPHLIRMELGFCIGMADNGLEHLREFKQLRILILSHWGHLSDDGLRKIGELEGLTWLEIIDCRGLTGKGLEHLKALKNLTELKLPLYRGLTDQSLELFKDFTKLERLDLSFCADLRGPGFVHLEGLKNLKSLNLDYCGKLRSEAFQALSRLKNLTELDLSNNGELTDQGFEQLNQLTRLKLLNLNYCRALKRQLHKLQPLHDRNVKIISH